MDHQQKKFVPLAWGLIITGGISLLVIFWLIGSVDANYSYVAESSTQSGLGAVAGVVVSLPPVSNLTPSSSPAELPAVQSATTSKPAPFPMAGNVVVPFASRPEAEIIPGQVGKIKILLLGTDARSINDFSRTDVLVLVVIDPDKKQINFLSFPRDLYVVLPGGGMGRINNAYAIGGPAGLNDTLQKNFGVSFDHYVLTSFQGFINLIDSLGGATVNVGQEFADWRAGKWTVVKPGLNNFTSAEALWYARSRETSNDLDRNRRAQEVLQGLLLAILRPENIGQAGIIYQELKNNITTDISVLDLTLLITEASRLGSQPDINKFTFTGREVSNWTEPGSGAQVLVFDPEAVAKLASRALGE